MSIGGLATGIIALALAAVGVSLIIGGVHRLDNDLNNFNVGPNAQAQHQVNTQERNLIHQGQDLWK
jgi:predicted phage tail protein